MEKSNLGSPVIQTQQIHRNLPHHEPNLVNNQNYFSLLCRNGPLPQKYHRNTDIFCLIIYLVLLILMIILVFMNGLSNQRLTYQKQNDLKKDLFYGSRFFLWQTIFASMAIMIMGFVLSLFALYIPKVMSIFSIGFLLFLCILFTVVQFSRFFKWESKIFLYIWKGLISLVVTIITGIMVVRRRQKIMNLGLFLQLPSKVIRSHMCLIFTQIILLSLLEMSVWYAFVNLYYHAATVTQIERPFVYFLTKLIVVIMWLWTSGVLIALSDYMTTSYTVNWFYNLSKNQDLQQVYIENEDPFSNQERASISLSQNKFTTHTFRPLYKKLCSQLGTVIFGAILAYLPLYLISKIQKILFKSSTKEFGITTFSKYGYLDTIMEWQSFVSANQRTYDLRKRIKSVMPELYMLGHIYGDFTKLGLVLIGIALIHELVEFKSDVAHHSQLLIEYSFTILLFGIGIGLQIATNFTNLIGKCGDIVFFLYCIDNQIQRVHFGQNSNYSTPKALWHTIRQLTVKRDWKSDS